MRNTVLLLLAAMALGAPATVSLPENLKGQGIPAIPVELTQELARYTETRSASFSGWHPTERRMLISTRFGNTPQVHELKMPGGARRQLTFYQDRVGGASYQPKLGNYIVFSKDAGGGEWFQLYAMDVKTRKVALLTDGKSRNGGPVWSKDGTRFAFTSTMRNNRDSDIYVMSPDKPQEWKQVFQAPTPGWAVSDWSADGRRLLIGQYLSAERSVIHLLDLETGSRTALTPVPAKASYGDAEFSPDGKTIYFTTDEGSEFEYLASMDLATKKVTNLTPSLRWGVQGFSLSPDGTKISYVTNEDGVSRLRLMDPKGRPLMNGKDLLPGDGVVGGGSWRPDGKEIAITFTSARTPADVYTIDVETAAITRWTESEALVDTSRNVLPKLIRWKSFDGLEVSGFLYAPDKPGKVPVIINIHGGPEGQSRPGFVGTTNYYINELGVAVIYPNVRGSTGYGKTYLSLDNGMKRLDSVKDIGALLDWIAVQPNLDASRVMVTGGSYGGYMTLASMVMYNDRLRCGVDVVGISNFVTFLQNTESYRRDLRRAEYGDERDPAMKDHLATISPANNAQKITKPMFIVQGKNDPRVPYTESEQMVAAIRKNGAPVWYLLAEDEGHGFAKKSNQEIQLAATVMFIREALLK